MNHTQAPKLHTTRLFILLMGLVVSASSVGNATAQDADSLKTAEVKNVNEYAGSYEGRVFTVYKNTLSYKRDGMPMPAQLKPIGDDEFEIIIPAGAQVRGAINGQFPTMKFNRNEKGIVVSVSIIAPDKSVMGTHAKSLESPKGGK